MVAVSRTLEHTHTVRAEASSTPHTTPVVAKAPGGPVQLAVPGLVPGACMAYAPTHGNRGQTIFLDPGHGGPDPGASGTDLSGNTVLEKDATLGVALNLLPLLRADGYRVVLSRTTDSYVIQLQSADLSQGVLTSDAVRRDLVARVACANAAHAAVLLSIHFDGFSDPTVGGAETLYDAVRSFASRNQTLAQDLQTALVRSLGVPDRGIIPDDQLVAPTLTDAAANYGHLIELGPAQSGWVQNPSQMPGALVEPLFVTDPAEAQMVATAAGQLHVARALQSGLLAFLQPHA